MKNPESHFRGSSVKDSPIFGDYTVSLLSSRFGEGILTAQECDRDKPSRSDTGCHPVCRQGIERPEGIRQETSNKHQRDE
jgi:hypothetical protein